MEKLAEFKQERFVILTNEKRTIKYEDPIYCVLYKRNEKFLLIKHINDTEIKLHETYKNARIEFCNFVEDIIEE